METRVEIKVGHVSIAPSRDGYVWLSWDDGEGMEVEEAKFAAFLERFYQENF